MSNDYNGKKRSELPDSVFGIPQERKYPMPDEKHTRSAIKLFNHVEPKYEEQLAKAIIKNMKKYNIDGSVVGPNNRLRKYLPKDMIKEGVVYIDYTLIKGAQPPYSAKNHRVYDGNLLKEATTEVINEKLNIFKKSSNDSGRKSREEAYRKATSHVTKYLSKYIGLRKGQVIYASSNVHLDEYMNPKDRLQIFEDFMNGKRKSIAIYHNMIYNNYGRKGFDWTKENILKPVDEMCDAFDHDGYELCAGVNEQYTSLLVSLRVKSVNESSMFEGYIKSDKDIYYNKDKFDSGEINLCFITGLSGSGKSTMARGMTSKNIEHYEMDDIICNDNFSDSNLKEYGGLIESFFKGPGKSFRLIRDNDTHNNSVFKSHKNYEKEITQAFVKHALSYCKSHMNTKFICDGIWVFMFINPSQLKDCAVYIKGTSSLKSGYRALKRDIDEDKRNNMTSLDIFKREFRRIKEDVLYAKENQKELKSFRSYFEKQSTNESVSSTVSKDHKQKGYIKLSSLKKIRITETIINKYKKEYPVLRHVRCKDTDEYVCDGYMWFKDDNLVCYVGSCQYTDDNTKWIVSLEILPEYRGYGLSTQILDFCVKSMKCKYLSVNKNNELAKKIYDKYGFKVYHEDKTMYYMTLDSIIKESVLRIPILEDCSIKNIQIMKDIIKDSESKEFKGFRFTNISYYKIEYDNDKPIGFGTVRTKLIDDNTIGYVSVLVLPKYRGKGYGTKITEDIIDWFKGERSIDFLEWRYKPDNDASKALANKAGFIEYIATDEDQWKRTYMKNESSLLSESDSSKRNPYQYTVIKFLNRKIKPFVLGNKEWRKRAKDIHLTLTFKIHDTVSRYIGVTILDGSQEYRDTDQARHLLKEIKSAIIDYSKHIQEMKLIKRVNLGDGDEGSIYFDLGFINMIIHRSLDAKVVGEQVEDIPTVNSNIYLKESIVSEYGTTGGTMVGSNQPDSVYIVNYMQNNAFSGYKEPKFGICKKGMKNLHVVSGKYNKFHQVDDIDEFSKNVSDIHVYRYRGKPKTEFVDILKDMEDINDDLKLYEMITGRAIEERADIAFDPDFAEEISFTSFLNAVSAITEATALQSLHEKEEVPVLTETVQGRPYNFYRDLNGVYCKNELTNIRTMSYDTIEDIPMEEIFVVKRGYI